MHAADVVHHENSNGEIFWMNTVKLYTSPVDDDHFL